MNNHIYYKDVKYMSLNINNHHDKILIPEVGGQIKWYMIGVNQSKTLFTRLVHYLQYG